MSDALINGLSGAGGGIIAQLITYPLQTVNTRQQTERDLKKEKRKVGTIAEMCQVVKHEGWGRLYGGLTPSLAGTAASQGVYYYFYQIFRSKAEAASLERMKKGVGDGSVGMLTSLWVAALSGNKAEAASLERMKKGVGDGSVGMLTSLWVAALSGCVNVLLTNPIWVVVTRMQTHTKTSKKIQPDQSQML
nr:peroxisomal nicotinamide adenine dinucleotide carrier [Quercus suber]